MLVSIKNIFSNHEKAISIIAPFFILTMMFFIALFSSYGAFGIPGDSGTFDEIAHIPSGYTYIKDNDLRLNPEHPPLPKALSGIFMVLAGIKGPEQDESWNSIDQWKAGNYMIYKNGNSAEEVFFWARLPMMLLMIGLGVFLYKWALKLYGLKTGLIVLTLFAFYPDIIAHGRLVTTDIAAAFGYVITIYYFDKAMTEISWKNTAIAGIAFGVAQLCKMSALVLFVILFLLVLIKAFMEREENKKLSTSFWIYFKPYFWICLISFVFVWIVYIAFMWGTPPQIEHKLIENYLGDDPSTLSVRNFFHMFENNRITIALAHYILGIGCAVFRVIFGNFTYILGHVSMKTISWYFPVAWLLKTPVAIIILFLSSLGFIIFRFPKEKQDRWIIALIVVPMFIYWAVAIIGSLNIGIRHLIPTVPFALLLIGFFCKRIFEAREGITAPKIAVFILVGYLIISTISYYPEYIAYFNEATPRDARYTRLVDSSLDWGQDLLRLKKYIKDNNIKNIKLDYFGTADLGHYIPDFKAWDSEYGPTTGWLAISALFYQGSKLRGELYGKWSYHWLDSRKPVAAVGGSILVFHIDKDELAKNPAVSPYKITKVVKPFTGRKNSLFWDLLDYFIKSLKGTSKN